MDESQAMRRALDLAVRGWGRVAPNPMVGAVLLRDGEIIGEGHHAEFGGAHAEVAALAAAGDAAGATCVVTLEPCSHQGKTPPCTTALIEAGVARVVAATADPTATGGGGAGPLADAGIEVAVGLRAEEAAALNAPFLHGADGDRHRPFVALKLATSLDGFLADADRRSQWISGPESREFVHWLRAGFDAIGVGRRTAVIDDPLLTVRGPLEPRVPPLRVIFTRTGELPSGLRLYDVGPAPTAVVTASANAVEMREVLAHTPVRVFGADGLAASLATLEEAGVGSILVEGGGALAAALLDEDLVDRLYWIQAPIFLGTGVAAFGPRGGVPLEGASPWAVIERRSLGRDTLLVVDRALCLQG